MRTEHSFLGISLLLLQLFNPFSADAGSRCDFRLENRAGELYAILADRLSGRVWSDAPYEASLVFVDGTQARGLNDITIERKRNGFLVAGFLKEGAVRVTDRFIVPPDGDYIEEEITLENRGKAALAITDVAFGFQKKLDAATDNLRWVAVPFRRQVDGRLHDYSSAELRQRRFSNSDWQNDSVVASQQLCDAGRLRSEAWAWTDGSHGMLVSKYNDQTIEYSMALVKNEGGAARLCYGGAGLALYREPRAATDIPAGGRVTFGRTRYTLFDGSWQRGYELYRTSLAEHGHRLPRNYSPPLNWNELFDVGWYHSDRAQLLRHYTREALFQEAAKAREVGCDLLYLDPGWEICEGTTLWETERLGKVGDFAAELKKRYGLGLGYRTIGRVYRNEFPNEWYLRREHQAGSYERPSPADGPVPQPVPLASADGRRNVALLPQAKASASSVIAGFPEKHTIPHLNDGYYNNSASWISAGEPSWVELDLGAEYEINELALGSEHTPAFRDRAIVKLDVSVASAAQPQQWRTVAEYEGKPVAATKHFHFQPVRARRVRVAIHKAENGAARIDELEIYEAAVGAEGPQPVRGEFPKPPVGKPLDFWEACTQSREWQKEKLKRILAITGGGVSFMMFDEFDWRGPCFDAQHGHVVPSTPEGHVRAVYGLIEAMRKKYPGVLVEAHDPVWPWTARYLPSYFLQGFTGNHYQENWGFEFMWNPIEDLKSGRALCLYYYNLGCDIPLYDHITMEADNDQCLSFWWYASTVRHLGIGGKKGLNSPRENEARFQAYKKAVADYNLLRPFYARGRFVGLDETAHLHLEPKGQSAVLNLFNLTDKPVHREVRVTVQNLGWRTLQGATVTRASSRVEGQSLVLTAALPPMSPLLIELRPAGASGTPR